MTDGPPQLDGRSLLPLSPASLAVPEGKVIVPTRSLPLGLLHGASDLEPLHGEEEAHPGHGR